ncbi:hypothetical protein [Micromonospora marina]|uniref:hypothetical protein n=1 Tax=Micromonospora marina TaxID=307120 RepID=UPI003455BF5A
MKLAALDVRFPAANFMIDETVQGGLTRSALVAPGLRVGSEPPALIMKLAAHGVRFVAANLMID